MLIRMEPLNRRATLFFSFLIYVCANAGKRLAKRHFGWRRCLLGFAGLLLSAVVPVTLCLAAPPALTVRVGGYANHPKIFQDGNGRPAGFWPDLLAEIAHRENWKLIYVWGTWGRGLERLVKGRIDVMPDVAYTLPRSKKYVFCQQPVLMSWSRLYVHTDDTGIESIRDLDHKTIAALKDSVNLEGPGGMREIARQFYLDCTFVALDDYDQVFDAIARKAVDAGITNRNFGNRNADRYPVRKTAIIFQPITVKFAFPMEGQLTERLVHRVDAQLQDLRRESESVYYRLLEKYFEAEIAEKEVEVLPAWLITLMKAGIVILVSFFMVVVFSRFQVRRKTDQIRRASAELKASERRYREIFNAPSDAIFIHDAESGRILDVNQAMLEMYACTREQAMALTPDIASSGIPPYTADRAVEFIRKAITEEPQTFEWHARRQTGELFWVEVSLKHKPHSKGGYVIAVVRDITDRKKAEEALVDEKERLAVTLTSIGDGVIAADTGGKVVLMNTVAAQLTGWTAPEAKGRSIGEVFCIVDEKTGEPSIDPAQKVLESGRIVGSTNHRVLVSRDGSRRTIADSGAPIRNRQQQIVGVVLVFRDETDRIRMASELRKSEKLRSVGVLAGGIAHDFNNILMAIIGNISLARQLIQPDDESSVLLEEAEKACLRAKDLTHQLLTFARGGEPIKQTALLVGVITDSANFVLRGSRVTCSFDIAQDLWLVDADTGQISQVIQNLVLNARQAMAHGGEIRIRAANVTNGRQKSNDGLPAGRWVKIEIADQGIGIPAKYIDTIFDPYYSTKQDGSGLGLAIVHSIITKHGGHVFVKSSSGEGTTFTLYLPATDGRMEEKPIVPEMPRRTGQRVLVMDDEKMIRDLAGKMLPHLGYEAVLAEDGQQAVDIYQSLKAAGTPPDLVILDLTVPGQMGGEEAVRHLLDIDPSARVIVASGYSNDPVMANYKKYGFAAAITKPFTLPALSRTLSLALSAASPPPKH